MADKVYTARYSGPNRSGICRCGCKWEKHHRMLVARQEYLDQTHEGYILGECEAYGSNELGGRKYNKKTKEWEYHCFGYIDSLDNI